MTLDTTQSGATPPSSAPSPAGAVVFRDPRRITNTLKIILWIVLVLDVVAAISSLFEYQLLQQIQSGAISGSAMTAAADADDARQRIIGLGQIILFVITVVAFGRWIYVLHSNKAPLGATGLRFSPGWSVGWFFIPFANLWKPYQAMKELWLVSADPLHWQQQRRSALLPWWWTMWLVSNVLGQISFRLGVSASDISTIFAANIADILSDSCSAALEIIAIVLVGRIATMQLGHRPSLSASA